MSGELEDFLKLLMSPFAGFTQINEDTVDGLRISTIHAGDLDVYETAVCDVAGAHPVERYETREAAEAGHKVWLAKAPDLRFVYRLGYGSIVEEEPVYLERSKGEP
jgi:hypothetical protein